MKDQLLRQMQGNIHDEMRFVSFNDCGCNFTWKLNLKITNSKYLILKQEPWSIF